MRTLAVDLGSRRVGLALSDEGARFATPFDVLTVDSPAQATAEVLAIIKKEGVRRLVVGLPINMDGTFGRAAREASAWAQALSKLAAIPFVMVDERLSSFEAEQQLNDRKRGGERITRAGRKKQLDALAAAGFLQEFLDGRLSAIEHAEGASHEG